jgi:hypothetical protein
VVTKTFKKMDSFDLLPAEILIKIFSSLSLRDVVRGVIPSNKRFHAICNWDNDLWEILFKSTFGAIEWFLLKTFIKQNEQYSHFEVYCSFT